MTRFSLRAGCTVRQLPDGDAVVAAGEGETAVIVNGSAQAVLDLLAQGGSEREIGDFLCAHFPAQDPDVIRRDVAALLAELERAGLLERSDRPPPTAERR